MQPISVLPDVDVTFSSGSSSSSAKSGSSIPEGWRWILDIMEEAHLPKLGLPVRWDKTKEKHALIAFDPETNQVIDVTNGRTKKSKISPIGFIESTKSHMPMPGTETPASARLTRYLEPCFHQHFFRGSHGETLVPCIAHGDYVNVESLQTDHAQAKEEIQKRQQAIVARLNNDIRFANFVMSLEGIDKFFVKVGDKYYGTLYFYELYFNDIDNLWLICGACNLHKSNQESLAWFKDQWLYGDEFLDYVGRLSDTGILTKAQNKQGLAEVAIQWYWNRHANYASISKRLMQDVVKPVQILNQRVDRVVGLVRAGEDERRLHRHMASLDFRVALLSAVANMKGIDMPRAASESPHPSSDEEGYMRVTTSTGQIVPITLSNYQHGTETILKKIGTALPSIFSEEMQKSISQAEEENALKRPRLGGK